MKRLSVGWILLLAMTIAALAGCAPASPAAPGMEGVEAPAEATANAGASAESEAPDGKLVVLASSQAEDEFPEWAATHLATMDWQMVTTFDPEAPPNLVIGVDNYFDENPSDTQTNMVAPPIWTAEVLHAANNTQLVNAEALAEQITAEFLPTLDVPSVEYILKPGEYESWILDAATAATARRPRVCCAPGPGGMTIYKPCHEDPLALVVPSSAEVVTVTDWLEAQPLTFPVIIGTQAEMDPSLSPVELSTDIVGNLPDSLGELIDQAGGN